MRRLRALGVLVLLAFVTFAPAGCGGKFELPTEQPNTFVPTDQSYAMVATWTGMTGVLDLLMTQGEGDQLFALFNHGGTAGPFIPRGDVKLLPRLSSKPVTDTSYFNPPKWLFNPVALSNGSNPARLFVLDQGDSCMAKYDPRINSCAPDEDTTFATGHPFRNMVYDYYATWRVREYSLSGGDTVSTFTDTTFAQPFGIAADNQGRVYVAGQVVVLDTSQVDQRIRTRKMVSRVYRYKRGLRYPGILDVNMPGTTQWHRDTSWVVFDGSGASSVADPRGIHWSPDGMNPVFIADRSNNQAKGVSSSQIGVPVVRVDGAVTGSTFNQPEGVTADLAGYFYVVDRGNRRVLRFSLAGEYIQRVDVEPNAQGLPLLDPTSIAVDDSLAWIADRGRGQIVRYQRRP